MRRKSRAEWAAIVAEFRRSGGVGGEVRQEARAPAILSEVVVIEALRHE
jgi:hypothetical protein